MDAPPRPAAVCFHAPQATSATSSSSTRSACDDSSLHISASYLAHQSGLGSRDSLSINRYSRVSFSQSIPWPDSVRSYDFRILVSVTRFPAELVSAPWMISPRISKSCEEYDLSWEASKSRVSWDIFSTLSGVSGIT